MHDPSAPPPPVPPSQVPTIDLATTPGLPCWRWIIDRNPLFLISGVFMLAGCFLISRHIHELDPADVGEGFILRLLVGLLVVLNLYEFAVITLGLTLARSRTLVRDARHLLGLALLLLIDVGFIYTESGIASTVAGLVIAVVATQLAWFKVWLIARSLRLRLSRPALGVIAGALAGTYLLPTALRAMADDGFLSQPQALLVWGAVGVALALHALPMRWVRLGVAQSGDHRQLQRLVAGGLVVLPVVSLVGHAAAALWVYECAFEPSMLAPLMLGLAAVLLRHHGSLGGARPTAQAATLMVASAVVSCLAPGDALVYESPQHGWLAMSPLRGVLLVAPLLLFWAWWVAGRRVIGAFNPALPLIAALLGHTPSAMYRHTAWLLDQAYAQFIAWAPTSKLQWGGLAIAAAFGCLLFGGTLSLWRRTRERARAAVGELLTGTV